jgi:hypothetical protein
MAVGRAESGCSKDTTKRNYILNAERALLDLHFYDPILSGASER